MSIHSPAWYKGLEHTLELQWPLMIALSTLVIGITIFLLWFGNPVALAAWLVYLYMP